MPNNNTNNNNINTITLDNGNKIKIGSDGRFIYDKLPEREYKYIGVSFFTGDQFTKTCFLRSKDGTGTVTPERVKKFYDDAAEECWEWEKNHPGESVTIKVLEDEDGKEKQIIETVPKKDLICPDSSRFQGRIYDPNTGKQIVGEKNIREELIRRGEQWKQWEKEGKIKIADQQIHHTDDGNIFSFRTHVPPAKQLHENEINDETMWISFNEIVGGKRIESGQENQQTDENKISEGSIKNEEHAGGNTATGGSKKENIDENIQKESKTDKGSNKEENVEANIVEKIKKDINEWSVKELEFTLSSRSKGKKDCLVHSSAKVNISELGTLIYPVEIFTESERKELSEVLNNSNSLFANFISSGRVGKLDLNKDNYLSVSLPNSSISDNNSQQTDKGKNILIVFGVVFVLLVAGLAIAKSRFSKNKK